MKLVQTSCLRSARQGRVKVSLLEQVWVKEAPKHSKDFQPEQELTKRVVAIQLGKKRRNRLGETVWVNETLYLDLYAFESLQLAIDDYNDDADAGSKDGEGNKPSSNNKPVRKVSGKRKLTDAEKKLAELADGGGDKPSSDFSDDELIRGDAE